MAQNSVALDGVAVRDRRRALLLTQSELAERVGIHLNTMHFIEAKESYRTSFATAKALAKYLGCTPADILLKIEEAAS